MGHAPACTLSLDVLQPAVLALVAVSLNRRLDAWLREGIIDADTSAKIRAYEDDRNRPLALHALIGLGALAIGIGLVAVVAANWERIPAWAKLAMDLALGICLALAIDRSLQQGRRLTSEALILVYYLFVLASVGLLGQIYQTGVPLRTALAVWSVSTLGLLFLTSSTFAAVLWAAGLLSTYALNAAHWIEQAPPAVVPDLTLSLVALVPFGLLVSSWLVGAASRRAAQVFQSLSWMGFATGAFVATFFWYVRLPAWTVSWGAAVLLAVWVIPSIVAKHAFGERAKWVVASIGVAVLATLLPLWIAHPELELVGGLMSLAVLGYFAFAASSTGHRRVFSLLTGLIGARIVAIYFEVFGSLMSTGLGLITGGALTLLLAWAWTRMSKDMVQSSKGRP